MAEEYVNVPAVLPDSLKDEFLKDSIAAAMSPIKREMLWCNINRHHDQVVAHYQANPVISDDAKGLNYYQAIACEERPCWVPSQIYIKFDIYGRDGCVSGVGARDCRACPETGRVYVETDPGVTISLYPKQFRVITWRKNEAENAG